MKSRFSMFSTLFAALAILALMTISAAPVSAQSFDVVNLTHQFACVKNSCVAMNTPRTDIWIKPEDGKAWAYLVAVTYNKTTNEGVSQKVKTFIVERKDIQFQGPGIETTDLRTCFTIPEMDGPITNISVASLVIGEMKQQKL
jgi:hypothetical protein